MADELEFADEDDDEDDDEHMQWGDEGLDEETSGVSLDEGVEKLDEHSMRNDLDLYQRDVQLAAQTDGARDSGVDVAYKSSPTHHSISSVPLQSKQQPHRNFSRPMSRDSDSDHPSGLFTLEMEDAINAIARLANPPPLHHPDAIPNALSALQHLTPQSALEANTQRLTTSTNSISSHLAQQTRIVSSLSSSFFTPLSIASPLDVAALDDMATGIAEVLRILPMPDARALQALTKLDRETTDLLHTLSALTDSLQMGKQATTSASRHLRNTLTMVTQLRRESDLAEQAKWKIEKEGWERKLGERWCAKECGDVVGGFEQVCEGLRRGLEDRLAT